MKNNFVFVSVVALLVIACGWFGFEYYRYQQYNESVETEDSQYKLDLKAYNKRLIESGNDISVVMEIDKRVKQHDAYIAEKYSKYMRYNLIFR